jgi:hypothetical protein
MPPIPSPPSSTPFGKRLPKELDKWKDKRYRLENIYQIKDAATGRTVPFVPRPEQCQIYDLLQSGVRKLIILKARRLGCSTAIGIYCADEAIWNAGVQISIIDKNQNEAGLKLNTIVKVAYRSLPLGIRETIREYTSSNSAWEVGVPGRPTSTIFGGITGRGGTNQILHISELGVVQFDDPKRAEEILTGAMPSAEHGAIIIESTWKGGKHGHLWNLVKGAVDLDPLQRTVNDWHLLFFPWHCDPTYQEDGDVNAIEEDTARYLAEKEMELGAFFTDRQKVWYARRKRTLGLFMYREFPSDLAECFKAPIEGAIYASLLAKLRGEGGMNRNPIDRNHLVHTSWDLGSPINTVVWYFQVVGGEIRVIDCDCNLDITPAQRVARMMAKDYLYAYHYLPHDASATQKSGKTFAGELHDLGLRNIKVVGQTVDVWIGINHLRGLFERLTFRVPQCEAGVEMLELYHTKRETATGLAVDIPVHDASSHYADALRTMAEAEMSGYLVTTKKQVTVLHGFRGDDLPKHDRSAILDAYFGTTKRTTRVIR